MNKIWQKQIKTAAGTFHLEASRRGLRSLDFPQKRRNIKRSTTKAPAAVKKMLAAAGKILRAYTSEDPLPRKKVKVDWTCLKGFERKVLRALYRVSCGKTVTYVELAQRSGHPKAARAVGSVMRRNQLPIFLPCHRVVRSDGTLGEYGPGRIWKKRLLMAEGTSRP